MGNNPGDRSRPQAGAPPSACKARSMPQTHTCRWGFVGNCEDCYLLPPNATRTGIISHLLRAKLHIDCEKSLVRTQHRKNTYLLQLSYRIVKNNHPLTFLSSIWARSQGRTSSPQPVDHKSYTSRTQSPSMRACAVLRREGERANLVV